MHASLLVRAAAAALALGFAPAPGAAPAADPWPRWSAHDPAATAAIDHGPWGHLLARHVRPGADGISRVAYGAFSDADRQALSRYLGMLAATPISGYRRAEQLAFWINLYNALTVQIVLEHYPVASIRDIDISPGLFSDGPWGAKLVRVEGVPLSLDDIEHRILRPLWRDPRVHYAVNCASLGCPDLRAEPFTGAGVEAALDAAARAYVNHPRGARVEPRGLVVSSIYVWFRADFGGTDAGVIAHLRRYAGPALAAALSGVERITDDAYDWSLNDATGEGAR